MKVLLELLKQEIIIDRDKYCIAPMYDTYINIFKVQNSGIY